MKRIFSLILILSLFLSFVACGGNFTEVNLNEPVAIPKNGIVAKSIFDEIKADNAVATFTGESGGMKYEWKIFGKEIGKTKDINLLVCLEESANGIKVSLKETEDFGFSALLSIYINNKWQADTAIAYNDSNSVYSVSLTGTDTTILNITIDKVYPVFEILPDKTEYDDDKNSSTIKTEDSSSNNTSIDSNSTSATTSSKHSTTSKPSSSNTVSSEKDKYQTDPVPEGKPTPVEPEDKEVDTKKVYTCIFSIECTTILNNLSKLNPDKLELIPADGIIFEETEVEFYEGESVFDLLQRVCQDNGIHFESEWTPMYNSAYIEGINNLYEFDCGELSGWQYRVDGWYPNYGCSRYKLIDGAKVEFRYTCDMGKDIGNDW